MGQVIDSYSEGDGCLTDDWHLFTKVQVDGVNSLVVHDTIMTVYFCLWVCSFLYTSLNFVKFYHYCKCQYSCSVNDWQELQQKSASGLPAEGLPTLSRDCLIWEQEHSKGLHFKDVQLTGVIKRWSSLSVIATEVAHDLQEHMATKAGFHNYLD